MENTEHIDRLRRAARASLAELIAYRRVDASDPLERFVVVARDTSTRIIYTAVADLDFVGNLVGREDLPAAPARQSLVHTIHGELERRQQELLDETARNRTARRECPRHRGQAFNDCQACEAQVRAGALDDPRGEADR